MDRISLDQAHRPMKKSVNAYEVTGLVGMLGALNDDEALAAQAFAREGLEEGARALIRRHILPEFLRHDDGSREQVKQSFRYFLTADTPDAFWRRALESAMAPIDAPPRPRDFFILLWEELFPGESYRLPSLEPYERIDELETWRYLRVRPELLG